MPLPVSVAANPTFLLCNLHNREPFIFDEFVHRHLYIFILYYTLMSKKHGRPVLFVLRLPFAGAGTRARRTTFYHQ